jgi:hypothetical protein
VAITIRGARDEDAAGIGRLGQENSAYYVQLAPEYFRLPDEEGTVVEVGVDEWNHDAAKLYRRLATAMTALSAAGTAKSSGSWAVRSPRFKPRLKRQKASSVPEHRGRRGPATAA